jgi:hypothetical protein
LESTLPSQLLLRYTHRGGVDRVELALGLALSFSIFIAAIGAVPLVAVAGFLGISSLGYFIVTLVVVGLVTLGGFYSISSPLGDLIAAIGVVFIIAFAGFFRIAASGLLI